MRSVSPKDWVLKKPELITVWTKPNLLFRFKRLSLFVFPNEYPTFIVSSLETMHNIYMKVIFIHIVLSCVLAVSFEYFCT